MLKYVPEDPAPRQFIVVATPIVLECLLHVRRTPTSQRIGHECPACVQTLHKLSSLACRRTGFVPKAELGYILVAGSFPKEAVEPADTCPDDMRCDLSYGAKVGRRP